MDGIFIKCPKCGSHSCIHGETPKREDLVVLRGSEDPARCGSCQADMDTITAFCGEQIGAEVVRREDPKYRPSVLRPGMNLPAFRRRVSSIVLAHEVMSKTWKSLFGEMSPTISARSCDGTNGFARKCHPSLRTSIPSGYPDISSTLIRCR